MLTTTGQSTQLGRVTVFGLTGAELADLCEQPMPQLTLTQYNFAANESYSPPSGPDLPRPCIITQLRGHTVFSRLHLKLQTASRE